MRCSLSVWSRQHDRDAFAGGLGAIGAAVLALALLAASQRGLAGGSSPSEPPGGLRLVLFEAADCRPCALLRKELLQQLAGLGDEAAARSYVVEIIDAEALGSAGHPLRAPLRVLPTLVIMDAGRERVRLEGYAGAAGLAELLARLTGLRLINTKEQSSKPTQSHVMTATPADAN